MMATSKRPHSARNKPVNAAGLMKYSRARVFQRKAVYKLKKTKAEKKPAEKTQSKMVVKKIGGEKNGGERKVYRKAPKSLPTQVKERKVQLRPRKTFKKHTRRLRSSLKPGTIVILLAGRHKGKRVLLLKQLPSGLLLVTGPLRLNGCPLRRISQRYVIATKTRVDLKDAKLPERINDAYFRRQKRQATKESGDIFAADKAAYQLSAERKEDQAAVDKAVMAAIKASEDGKLLRQYLSSLFSLSSGQRPHQMTF